MQNFTSDLLLRTWEMGMADSRASARVLALLGAACPSHDREELARFSVGRCDGMLLAMRERLFGRNFNATVSCPQCAQELELEFDAAMVKAGTRATDPHLDVKCGDYTAKLRAPCVEDLAALECEPAVELRRTRLLARVVVAATHQGGALASEDLPAYVVQEIERCLEDADAQMLSELGMQCAACLHQWSTAFDIAYYLWIELDRWARRLLWEVHALARAYAWHECDLIAMSPWRRQCYLDMLAT